MLHLSDKDASAQAQSDIQQDNNFLLTEKLVILTDDAIIYNLPA